MITSLPDLIIIGGVVLLVFGPKRLPELAKSLGKGVRDFKKAMEGGFDEKEVLPPAENPKETEKESLPHPTTTGDRREP